MGTDCTINIATPEGKYGSRCQFFAGGASDRRSGATGQFTETETAGAGRARAAEQSLAADSGGRLATDIPLGEGYGVESRVPDGRQRRGGAIAGRPLVLPDCAVG